MIDIPQVTDVQVEPVQPETADLRAIRHLETTRSRAIEPVTWVVRVALDQIPTPSGQALELLVGEEIVRKYSQVEDGIAFVVNDPDRLQSMLGKELSWRIPGDDKLHPTGVHILNALPAVSNTSALPTKREVLQRR